METPRSPGLELTRLYPMFCSFSPVLALPQSTRSTGGSEAARRKPLLAKLTRRFFASIAYWPKVVSSLSFQRNARFFAQCIIRYSCKVGIVPNFRVRQMIFQLGIDAEYKPVYAT